jgi:hypothetical protein
MALADTTIENDLRRKLNETRKALRNLLSATDAYAEAVFLYDNDSKEAERAAVKLDKRAREARQALGFGSQRNCGPVKALNG